jgi:hypothetical protein
MSRFANGAYLVVVLAVSFANIVLNRFVGEANREDRDFYNETKSVDRIMWIDIAIKVVGFGIAKQTFFYQLIFTDKNGGEKLLYLCVNTQQSKMIIDYLPE